MKKTSFKKPLIWFVIFLIFTALVKLVDVQPVGPDGTMIGFARINKAVWDKVGVSTTFYNVTQFFGIVAIGICLCFAILGVDQLIKRKQLHYVDSKIIAMGIYYIIVMAFYAFFMFVAINYRPVYINNEPLESSYPSSHTMLALTVVAAFVMYNDNFKNVKKKVDRIVFTVACYVFGAVTVIGRLLSGVHWFTDIIGSVLLSIAIIEMYKPLCDVIQDIHDKKEAKLASHSA